jgi:hypothetical protein
LWSTGICQFDIPKKITSYLRINASVQILRNGMFPERKKVPFGLQNMEWGEDGFLKALLFMDIVGVTDIFSKSSVTK